MPSIIFLVTENYEAYNRFSNQYNGRSGEMNSWEVVVRQRHRVPSVILLITTQECKANKGVNLGPVQTQKECEALGFSDGCNVHKHNYMFPVAQLSGTRNAIPPTRSLCTPHLIAMITHGCASIVSIVT